MDIGIERLTQTHAASIIKCFERVYGNSYANELFYDAAKLTNAMDEQRVLSVGAVGDGGQILGHMAMTIYPGAKSVELGNTVVDPVARGEGLAWKIGDELRAWCIEFGFEGYLHYPTTDHHIMQRQSVKSGFETGLMLGYIPAETDGKVHASEHQLRGAATIVFQPIQPITHQEIAYLPQVYEKQIAQLAETCGIRRTWKTSNASKRAPTSATSLSEMPTRDLSRLQIVHTGEDIELILARHKARTQACLHVDFHTSDPAIEAGVDAAHELGFVFCGWMPGYRESDVLRLQLVDQTRSDLEPDLENAVAQQMLDEILTSFN